MTCRVFRPDHNGECQHCDEWIDAHDAAAIAAGERSTMTHTRQYDDDEGTFSQWATTTTAPCPRCQGTEVRYRIWESHDGAFEDYQYRCQAPGCGHTWWVDGIDA